MHNIDIAFHGRGTGKDNWKSATPLVLQKHLRDRSFWECIYFLPTHTSWQVQSIGYIQALGCILLISKPWQPLILSVCFSEPEIGSLNFFSPTASQGESIDGPVEGRTWLKACASCLKDGGKELAGTNMLWRTNVKEKFWEGKQKFWSMSKERR